MILAIDPGNIDSAYVLLDADLRPRVFAKADNYEVLRQVERLRYDDLAIEMIASYGMAVGQTVFDTCVWVGRFWQACPLPENSKHLIYRKEEKMDLCHSMKAKDANIRQALIDRFGEVGTKKEPGWFYGIKADVWQAVAVGVTWADKEEKG